MELHMSYITKPAARLLVAAAAIAVLGCSGSDATGTSGGRSLSLSFAPTSATSSAGNASFALIPVTTGGHTLDLTSVELNLSKIELHSDQHIETVTKCEKGQACNLPGSPLVVTLSPTTSIVTLTSVVVPTGTYREIEVKIASVHFVGTFDGKPFDVNVNVNVDREIEFSPPVLIGDASDTQRNITIAVPLTSWLTNADGTLIDPSKIVLPGTLRSFVERKIQSTLRAFRDDNHNCRDDDNDEHEGDHEGHGN
jgi:hypothetical protein